MEHPVGYARVREYGDPDPSGRFQNQTMVYTWRQDLAKLMCQECSDFTGRPVNLSVNGCSKKRMLIQTADTGQLCIQTLTMDEIL